MGRQPATLRMIRFLASALTLLALVQAPALGQEAALPAAQPAGSGGDITRPANRADLRTEFNQKDGDEETTVTLRYSRPQPIGGGWQVNLRADLPLVGNSDDPDGERRFELGDMLFHAVFARHVSETEGFGIGTQLIVPSASDDSGKGKWQLRPTAGYRWSLPRISKESFFQLVARYDFSFAGDPNRDDVSELQFAPNLEIGLPGKAYVSLFPSTDFRYNFIRHEFFAPVNLELGKQFGRIVTSIEGAVGVIEGDHPPYDWKVEARVGLSF